MLVIVDILHTKNVLQVLQVDFLHILSGSFVRKIMFKGNDDELCSCKVEIWGTSFFKYTEYTPDLLLWSNVECLTLQASAS